MPAPGSNENEGKMDLCRSPKSLGCESTDIYVLQTTPKGSQTVDENGRNGFGNNAQEDIQSPYWVDALNKRLGGPSKLKLSRDEYRKPKSIKYRFDGPSDDSQTAFERSLEPSTLPRISRHSHRSDSRRLDIFQDQFRQTPVPKQRFDGSVEDSPSISGAFTLPCRTPRVRQRPSLKRFETTESIRSSRSYGSLQSLDRFVPRRRPTLDLFVESFRANKDLKSLSPDEKLIRNNNASPDAFNPRRRVTSPTPTSMQTRPLGRRHASANRSGAAAASVLTFQRDTSANGDRQVSVGTVWAVGGLAPVSTGVPSGRGGLLVSGTNAPLYTTSFSAARPKAKEDLEKHEGRLAEALELDRVSRILEFRDPLPTPLGTIGKPKSAKIEHSKTMWKGTEWVLGGPEHILDAPNLRDDFYCSVLAYSPTCHTIAVGLGSLLYAWSEAQGVHLLNSGNANGSWLTSLAFSSNQGCKSILAFGRSDGSLHLLSLYDSLLPRFEVQSPCPIACITWRPAVTMRPSRSPLTPGMLVKTEDLLVGDEAGNVYYYAVEWPDKWEVSRDGWSGAMTLIARISVHTQQICGLSFSNDGSMFATGGNDNLCCLFPLHTVLQNTRDHDPNTAEEVFVGGDGIRRIHTVAGRGNIREITSGAEKHKWVHGAAVKAIAFCPWRDGLVATGGGSNDKCIHFFHTTSGACLATISVAAQVTSLIWSTTRREIVATFGYAQPEHPYRIAVFSWPECRQVAAIPWDGEHRALYAIPYPGGPNESQRCGEAGRGLSRTAQEGCIVVASSDESVKFHEVWTASQKTTAGGEGLLGGSDILEGLEGIDKEGEVIR